MHAYMHPCMHPYIHTYTHTHIHTYITYITYITFITYIHTYIHAYTHTHIHAYTHTHTYRHTDIQTYIHTYKHTYIHTYIFCIYIYYGCMSRYIELYKYIMIYRNLKKIELRSSLPPFVIGGFAARCGTGVPALAHYPPSTGSACLAWCEFNRHLGLYKQE